MPVEQRTLTCMGLSLSIFFSMPLLLSFERVQSLMFRGELAVRRGSSRRILVFGGSIRPGP